MPLVKAGNAVLRLQNIKNFLWEHAFIRFQVDTRVIAEKFKCICLLLMDDYPSTHTLGSNP